MIDFGTRSLHFALMEFNKNQKMKHCCLNLYYTLNIKAKCKGVKLPKQVL